MMQTATRKVRKVPKGGKDTEINFPAIIFNSFLPSLLYAPLLKRNSH